VNLKLDENLGVRTRQVFLDAGHDVKTIRDEQLQGRPDEVIYDVCRLEQRCLVTLDLDFGNVLRFPSEPTSGIVVLRPNGRITIGILTELARQVVRLLPNQSVTG
jgi:predicted nuclease of predicted toxin-antitoxin system